MPGGEGTGELAVVVRGLRRVYRARRRPERVALDGLDLDVRRGEVHGLLGPSGAGKTTLCRILSTVLLPTSGTAHVLGVDVAASPAAVRPLIGVVFGGERGLYTRLSARQNLRYWAALYGRTDADRLLDRVGLADRADDRVETFSRGMKQRLHLARGLVGDPRVLLLDEPTAGLDPVAAHRFRDLVRELHDEGRTLLIATHDMAEAGAVCDRVSLVDGGRVLGTESPRTIGRWVSRYERVRTGPLPEPLVARLRALPDVVAVHEGGTDGDTLVELDGEGAAARVMRVLLDAGVTDLGTTTPSLEDVYLRVIGRRGLSV